MSCIACYRFGARLASFFRKRSEAYILYDEASISDEKANIVQKGLQRGQLCCSAGRPGL